MIKKLLFALFCFQSLFAQYTVKVRMSAVRELRPCSGVVGEWQVTVYADIFDANKNLVVPSGVVYQWEQDDCNGAGFNPNGIALSETPLDGNWFKESHIYCEPDAPYDCYYARVKVNIQGTWYTSAPVRVPDNGVLCDDPCDLVDLRKTVIVNQLNSNQQTAGTIGHVESNQFYNYPANIQFFPRYGSEVFRATQSLVNSEKYDSWQGISNIVNHKSFFITQSTQLIALLGLANNATVRAQISGGSQFGGVEFIDPWFPDDSSDGLGARNRGANAISHFVSSSTDNIGTGSTYHGVFLNKGDTSNLQPPFYSVRAQIMQTVQGSNYEAVFQGWSNDNNYANLKQVGSNPADYDQKAVVFRQSGATVTALYTTSNITTSVTIPAGTYTMAGTLTVSSGATLTLSPGTTLQFPASTKLVVNGILVANGTSSQRINFTKSGSSNWTGLEFNGANGSSITYANISYATEPVKVTSTSSFTMCQDSIRNASFSENGALQFYGSNPTISYVVIKGQSGASNGVRFGSGSTGSITSCTIRDLSAGNGIVLQGNSSPKIAYNTITNNLYHAIVADWNGSGNPIIASNWITNNASSYSAINIKHYCTAKMGSNTVTGSDFGIYWEDHATSYTNWQGSYSSYVGQNIVTNNNAGLVAYGGSWVTFGDYDKGDYIGACNQINNTTWNAYAATSSSILAEGNWWGQYPPQASKIHPESGSTIWYEYALPNTNCPGGGGGAVVADVGMPTMEEMINFKEAISNLVRGKYTIAKDQFSDMLSASSNDNIRTKAMLGLLDVFRETRDEAIVTTIESYLTSKGELDLMARQALMAIYPSFGRLEDAKNLALSLCQENLGTELEKAGLYYLASLKWFDEGQKETSDKYLAELMTKYGSTVDDATLAVLGISKSASEGPATSAAASGQGLEISNFPNPFNPSTTISFTLPEDGHVTLRVYDMLGRVVGDLLNETMKAGSHQRTFDASKLPSGVYFYRLDFGGKAMSKKFVLAK